MRRVVRLKSSSAQRLVYVDKVERSRLRREARTAKLDRRRREVAAAERWGPAACHNCGAEPCGARWRPEEPETSVYCCARCTHTSPPGYRVTHELWGAGHRHRVMELHMRDGDRLYMRPDGVVHWIALGDDHRWAPLLLGRAEPMAVLFELVGRELTELTGARAVGSLTSRAAPPLAKAGADGAGGGVGEGSGQDGPDAARSPAPGADTTIERKGHEQ